jgi:hypothetical protein
MVTPAERFASGLAQLAAWASDRSLDPARPGALFPRTEEVKHIVHSSERPQQIAIFIISAHMLDRLDLLSNRR